MSTRVAVWDLPVRLFHWLLAATVVGAVASAQIGGNLMVWHGRLGSLALGLVVFRLIWGMVGSRTARFADFVRGPAAIRAYLAGQWHGIGHNPLGAQSVLALLAAVGLQALSGHFASDDIAFTGPLAQLLDQDDRELATRWHHLLANLLYVLVGLHLAAIAFYALVKKQNLVRPMLHGTGDAPDGVAGNAGGSRIGLVIAIALAVLAAWAVQGSWIESPPPAPVAPAYDR